MPSKMSTSSRQSEDPLSLQYSHKSRAKSDSAIDERTVEHFSGLLRFGRVVASIFDRGRHMKYDYKVVQEAKFSSTSSRVPAALSPPAAHLRAISSRSSSASESAKTSRASSMVDYTSADGRLSVGMTSTIDSRRGSGESIDSRRQRRGGMSVS